MPTTCDIPLYHYNYCVLMYYYCVSTTKCDHYTTYCDATTATTSYTYLGPTSDPPTTTCGGSPLPKGRHHQPWEGGTGGYAPPWCQEEGCPGPRTTWRSPKAPSAPPGKGATWPPTAAPLPGPGPILGAQFPGYGPAPARGLCHLTPLGHSWCLNPQLSLLCPGLPSPLAPVIVCLLLFSLCLHVIMA